MLLNFGRIKSKEMSEAKEFDRITWAEAQPELPRCPGPPLDSWNSSAAKNAAKSVWSESQPHEMVLVNLDTDNLDTEYLQCFVVAEPKRQGSSDSQWAEQHKPIDSGLGLAQPSWQ